MNKILLCAAINNDRWMNKRHSKRKKYEQRVNNFHEFELANKFDIPDSTLAESKSRISVGSRTQIERVKRNKHLAKHKRNK